MLYLGRVLNLIRFARGILVLIIGVGRTTFSFIGYLSRKNKYFYSVLARRYISSLSLNSAVCPRPF